MKLEDAILEFCASLAGTLSPRTVDNYCYGLNRALELLGNRDVADIDRAAARKLRRALAKDTYKAATKNTVIASVVRLFAWLVEEGELAASPMTGLARFREDDNDAGPLPYADFLAMLNVANQRPHLRDVAILLFLYGTGCRSAGLSGLQMSDLDLANSRAWVREKGKERWIFLDDAVVDALRNYIERERPQTDVQAVFLSGQRRPLARKTLYQIVRKYARLAGVKKHWNPHSFRHGFAVNYLMNGGDLSSLSHILGHSDIAITHRYYARWATDTLQTQHMRYSPLRDLTPDFMHLNNKSSAIIRRKQEKDTP